MAQITCLVCSGRGIVLAHGLVDGAVDVGVDGLAALCRVRLNDFLLAFGHAELYFIIVVLDANPLKIGYTSPCAFETAIMASLSYISSVLF